LSLSFTNAHELTQTRDDSFNFSIKSSLDKRLKSSITITLIFSLSPSLYIKY